MRCLRARPCGLNSGQSVLVVAIGAAILMVASLGIQGVAQDVLETVRDNLVMVECECNGNTTEKGQGFIIGQIDSQVYVATAKHVVVASVPDCPDTVYVTFFSPRAKVERIDMRLDTKHDLAILVVTAPEGLEWNKKVLDITTPQIGEWVREFDRDEPWELPPASAEGHIQGAPAVGKSHVSFGESDVEGGDSGSPLVTRNGIVGMLQTTGISGNTALHINSIPLRISTWAEEWHEAWQLKPLERDFGFWGGVSNLWNWAHSNWYHGYTVGVSVPVEEAVGGIGSWDLACGFTEIETGPFLTFRSLNLSALVDLGGPFGDLLASESLALYVGGGVGFAAWLSSEPELESPFRSACGTGELGLRFYTPSGIGARASARISRLFTIDAWFLDLALSLQLSF